MSPRAKCFSFYSYKGGSGRSTTCVNTLLHLIRKMNAGPQHPILLVDTDLESAGLTYFFGCQKKFTARLSGAIDTASLLSGDIAEINTAWIFGRDLNTEARPVSPDVIRDLENIGVDDAGTMFGNIHLYPQERALLNAIVNSYTSRNNPPDPDNPLAGIQPVGEAPDYAKISRYCNLEAVFPALRSEKDADKKRQILIGQMPATRFVDISGYFKCQPGTVLFLGVDLDYQKEQVVRNDATRFIRSLLTLAGTHGYRAVLFDSSAGVQSTAHALQSTSDVVVYCMRPSLQFILGTNEQLTNYMTTIMDNMNRHRAEAPDYAGKPVILLPTVVPSADRYEALKTESFARIRQVLLAESYLAFIDGYFCTPETALNEVSLFKWHEQILGVPDAGQNHSSPEACKVLSGFYSEESLNDHEDAKHAYRVYGELADHLLQNSAFQITEEQ